MLSSRLFLLGEGDFSFTRSLPNKSDHPSFPPSFEAIVASSLDTRDEVLEKYPNFIHMKFGSKISIFHSVNALELSTWPTAVSSEYTVLWNHPHLGIENAIEHFQLMCHFFHIIPENQFSVVLSLIDGQFDRWRVEEAARKSGWYIQSYPVLLQTECFPGYFARRNLSGNSFKNTPAPKQTSVSFFYLFGRQREGSVRDTVETQLQGKREYNTKNFNFECLECRKSFASVQGLKTHVRQVHELRKYTDTDIRECEDCGEKFRGPEALHNHKIGVHAFRAIISTIESNKRARKEDEYCCEICGSSDPEHVVRFGRNADVETCEICGKIFRDKRALFQHISHIHSR